MHTGKVKKLVREKGFGFIIDDEGGEVFFHKNGLVGVDYDSLNEGDELQFEVEKTPKGSNAVDVGPKQ